MALKAVSHRYVPTNGIDMHIAELGAGEGRPAVVLLHGFPEIWYSWRHQILALSEAGFHAIAPDFRGYGLSRNTDPSKNDSLHCVDDIVGLLDALHLDQVYVVAKDWGAVVAHALGYMHPKRVLGLVVLGIPFFKPTAMGQALQNTPDGHYIKRWSVPGVPEADFSRFDVATVIRRIYILFSGRSMPIALEEQQTLDLVKASDPLPDWLTEEDLQVYAELYNSSGFDYPMEVPYRCGGRVAAKLADQTDFTISVPVLSVIGEDDYVLELGRMKQAFEMQRSLMPNVKVVHVEKGSHFVQEQFPKQISKLIIDFLNSNKTTASSE